MDNYWIGNEELVIVFRRGIHVVLSSEEDEPLYTGNYEKCKEFCKMMVTEYLESLY